MRMLTLTLIATTLIVILSSVALAVDNETYDDPGKGLTSETMWYRFEQDDTLPIGYDWSGNEQNLTSLKDGPSFENGMIGNGSARFDGIDDSLHINFSNQAIENITVSFWLNATRPDNQLTEDFILRVPFVFRLEYTGSRMILQDEQQLKSSAINISGTSNESHHYTITFGSSKYNSTFFKDGEQLADGFNSTLEPSLGGVNLSVGLGSSDQYFLGVLDDIRFFLNQTPNAGDIKYLYNQGAGNNNSLSTKRPGAENVSLTPSPASLGDPITGIAAYVDNTTRTPTSNKTRWYVNGTRLELADDEPTLGGGNVTQNANITFSIQYNNSYFTNSFVNSTTLTVGDLISPRFKGNSTNTPSIPLESGINLIVNVTENSGNIEFVKAEVRDPNQQKSNLTMSLNQGTSEDGEYIVAYTPTVVGIHNITFYAKDGNGNENRTGSELSFVATETTNDGGGGGGGGGSTTTIVTGNNTPNLFFGLTTISLTIISTPREVIRNYKFQNLGNAELENAKVSVIGRAKEYVTATVCEEPGLNCADERINLQSGETAFLRLTGTFDNTLGSGAEGIIRIQEQTTNGKTFDTLLSIDRPLFYKSIISKISQSNTYKDFFGNNQLPALIIAYTSLLLSFILVINFLRIIL